MARVLVAIQLPENSGEREKQLELIQQEADKLVDGANAAHDEWVASRKEAMAENLLCLSVRSK